MSVDEVLFLEASLAIAETIRGKFPEIECLKPQQRDAVLQYILRKDVFAVLPTGFGKSLTFQVIPDICRRLAARSFKYPGSPILLVICPLVSLITSHTKELESRGISSACLSGDAVDEEGIKAGKYSVVFASPESLIRNEKWRLMLRSKTYQENLFGIVTDEVHVVPKWGYGNSKEQTAAFRECFGKLGELRSLIPPSSSVLALTATASSETKATVIKSLSMHPDVVKIYVSPNRPNIYLFKEKVSQHLDDAFEWLIHEIKEKGRHTPKTVVYCKSQKDCGKLFRHFKSVLGDKAYYPLDVAQNSKSRLFGMYHHNMLKKHQEMVMSSLFNPDGVCRVVFASTALGMGINVRDIRNVIHYGPPRQMDDVIQEMGRARRDMLPSNALLLYTGIHLRKCDKAVKDYAKSDSCCLRKMMLKGFDESPGDFTQHNTHACCVVCHRKCKCGGATCVVPVFYVSSNNGPPMPQRKTRTVSEEQKSVLNQLLVDHQEFLSGQCDAYFLPPECCTGFSTMLIRAVLKKCNCIFTMEDVLELVPVYKKEHATEILLMIRDVFEDIEVDYDNAAATAQTIFSDYDLEYGGEYESCHSGSDSDSEKSTDAASGLSGISLL